MLPSITYLDLETTGATPFKDRITEIALVRFDNGIEVARWQTLVNPEQPIPVFIQQLTGINDEMVANAPKFAEVADQLLSFLEGSVLAAHNVRFDHGFIKSEFKRLNYTLRQKVICTVKLSRLLYPQHRSHGLDAIMLRHNITSIARHRAMGDVESILAFLASAKLELGDAAIMSAATQLMRSPVLPPHLDANLLEDMPETHGVYLFYGESHLPIYIAKSANIRARVLSHFNSDHASTKELRFSQEVKHVEWIETAGDFSALLLESRLIKEYQPIYNRQLRTERQLWYWKLNTDRMANPIVTLVNGDEINPVELNQFFGTFKSERQAVEALCKLAEAHKLCPIVLGLEAGTGACSARKLQQCKGVCSGGEAAEIHYLRLQQALISQKLKTWPFAGKIGLREHNNENNITQIHIFEYWCYLGATENTQDLSEILTQKTDFKFDLNTYKILLKAFSNPKTEIISLPN
ncbi:MAG TPA: exonuclease domain-containing protein [Methylotenera sp.]|nr:exonuclease domain-containing protein [Methylotenera sp.]